MQLSRLVPRLLIYLQEPNSQPRCSKHWDFKLKANRRFDPLLVLETATEQHLALQRALELPSKLLNTPHDGPMLWLILGSSNKGV